MFSSAGKKVKPVVAMALWEEDLYGKPPTPLPDPYESNINVRPVNVHYYTKICFSIDGIITDDIIICICFLVFSTPASILLRETNRAVVSVYF